MLLMDIYIINITKVLDILNKEHIMTIIHYDQGSFILRIIVCTDIGKLINVKPHPNKCNQKSHDLKRHRKDP